MTKCSHSVVTSAFPRDKRRPPAHSTSALCMSCLFCRTQPYKDTYSNNSKYFSKRPFTQGSKF